MVDRGGLNYPIRVRDEFSKTTQRFRKELALSKSAFRDFQSEVKGSKSAASNTRADTEATKKNTKAKGDNVKAGKKSQTAAEKQAQANRKLARTIVELAKVQKQRERTAIALRNAQSADVRREQARVRTLERQAAAERKLAQSKDANFQATKRLNAADFRRTVILKQIEQLKARSAASFQSGNFRDGARQLKQAKALTRSLGVQNFAAQKLLFTFRRLVGVLLLFTLARRAVQEFNKLVKAGIRFNDTVQSAQLGIAGLVVTLGDVRDAEGESVIKAEQLGLALGLAREQSAKLRQDSLKTVATFEQLLDTFQVSVGPGLAAGLDLDEVRQLTVDISQAASALGVPQNQLAEEVRSLLSGTIQARTTRIATALGISNEDVRRLKETGELFDFLEEKFAGFGEAAELQARTTFAGITTLIKGLVDEVLGNAARPLFEELISLGNDLFDNFLSIRGAADTISPSPQVIEAFQQVFDALKRSVESFRELASGNGVEILDTTLGAIAITIDIISGAVEGLVSAFIVIADVVTSIGAEFGLTSRNIGATLGNTAKWSAQLFIALGVLKNMFGIIRGITVNFAIWVAAIGAVAKAFQFIFSKITGVKLNLGDVVEIITTSLLGAWFEFVSAIQFAAASISNFFGSALDFIVSQTKSKALRARAFINTLFGDDAEATELKTRASIIEKQAKKDRAARLARHVLELKDIKLIADARLKAIQDGLAETVGSRAGENAKGEGFLPGFDPKQAAIDAAKASNSFVSTANRSIVDLSDSLGKVNTEIEKAQLLLSQSRAATGATGVAGQIESSFNKEDVAAAERLRKIKSDLANVDREVLRLQERGPEAAGALNSALRDQELLQVAILNAEEQSLELAGVRAATIANKALPALREQSALLAFEVAAEQAKTDAISNGANARTLALVDARSAVNLAKAELAASARKNALNLQSIQNEAAALPPGQELDDLNAVINALAIRQGLEEEILGLRIKQLQAAQEEADLIANGSALQGLGEGLAQFAEQFSSAFQVGVNIARAAIDELTAFASQAIVDSFDPSKDSDEIKENFARVLQSIAQTILQELINLAIAKALIRAGFGDGGDEQTPEQIAAASALRLEAEVALGAVKVSTATAIGAAELTAATAVGAARVTTETTIAAIRLQNEIAIAAVRAASGGGGGAFSEGGVVGALAKGGQVPEHFGRRAQGLARGGFTRPAHIPASDTVPAWLTPGEFVMNKASSSRFMPMLEAMNGGNMAVVGSASAEAAGSSTGMQTGGLVSDQIAAGAAGGKSGSSTTVLPILVAGDSEMDQLTAGGRNAFLAFMREEAGNINSLLDRSNRQR